jgi:hypothetical protein
MFAGLTYMLGAATGDRLSPWPVVTGSLLGVLGMAGYLWRRHPRLGRSFDQAPLGGEGRAPTHPPKGPRAGGIRVCLAPARPSSQCEGRL